MAIMANSSRNSTVLKTVQATDAPNAIDREQKRLKRIRAMNQLGAGLGTKTSTLDKAFSSLMGFDVMSSQLKGISEMMTAARVLPLACMESSMATQHRQIRESLDDWCGSKQIGGLSSLRKSIVNNQLMLDAMDLGLEPRVKVLAEILNDDAKINRVVSIRDKLMQGSIGLNLHNSSFSNMIKVSDSMSKTNGFSALNGKTVAALTGLDQQNNAFSEMMKGTNNFTKLNGFSALNGKTMTTFAGLDRHNNTFTEMMKATDSMSKLIGLSTLNGKTMAALTGPNQQNNAFSEMMKATNNFTKLNGFSALNGKTMTTFAGLDRHNNTFTEMMKATDSMSKLIGLSTLNGKTMAALTGPNQQNNAFSEMMKATDSMSKLIGLSTLTGKTMAALTGPNQQNNAFSEMMKGTNNFTKLNGFSALNGKTMTTFAGLDRHDDTYLAMMKSIGGVSHFDKGGLDSLTQSSQMSSALGDLSKLTKRFEGPSTLTSLSRDISSAINPVNALLDFSVGVNLSWTEVIGQIASPIIVDPQLTHFLDRYDLLMVSLDSLDREILSFYELYATGALGLPKAVAASWNRIRAQASYCRDRLISVEETPMSVLVEISPRAAGLIYLLVDIRRRVFECTLELDRLLEMFN